FSQLSDFVGHHRESQPVFAGASRFNGRVQSEQVGLLGKVVNDFDDLADVVCPLPENVDDFTRTLDGGVDAVETVGRLFHGGNSVMHLFARPIGNVQQHLRGVGHSLNRSHHLVDGSRSL